MQKNSYIYIREIFSPKYPPTFLRHLNDSWKDLIFCQISRFNGLVFNDGDCFVRHVSPYMAHQEEANDKTSVVISRKNRENCKMICTCLCKAMVTFNFLVKKKRI